MKANVAVIDVDGSYLYRKQQKHIGHSVTHFSLPDCPLSGWESVSSENVLEMSNKVPRVTQG